jgi:hypothetical protein
MGMAVETELNLHGPHTTSARRVPTIDASQEDRTERSGGLDAVWELLHLRGNPPPSDRLPTELGPFSWNPGTSEGERPVGGWAKLALHENGSVCFNGHFYVPGAPSDVTACVFSVRTGGGTVYTFVGSDRAHATFGDGSRDDMDEGPRTVPQHRRRGGLADRFRPTGLSAGRPPTVWWQVRVVSTDADAALDVTTACRRANRWMATR